MKIFEWVQRKLSLSSSRYCRVSDGSTRASDVLMGAKNDMMLVAFDSEKDMDALLLHQTLGSIMLSVGTLGHADHFCTVHQQQQEEAEPPAEERSAQDHSGVGRTGRLFVQANDRSSNSGMEAKSMLLAAATSTEEESAEPLLKETKERRGERTTLAHLFAVDDSTPSDESEKVLREQKKKKQQQQQKKTKKGKESPTSAKTFMATNKLRLITRTLKKKIHPDVLAEGVSDVKWDGVTHEEMTKLEANKKGPMA